MKNKTKLILTFLLFTKTDVQYAQYVQPFEYLEWGLHYLHNFHENDFHKYWNSPAGIGTFFSMPFYTGNVNVGVDYLAVYSRNVTITDFQKLCMYLGWSLHIKMIKLLTWYNGFGVGNNFMIFDKESYDGFKYESEMGIVLNSRLSYQIHKKVRINIMCKHYHIFTHKKIDLTFFIAGTSYTFSTPQWLKDFLR